jgi:hypothetical protein
MSRKDMEAHPDERNVWASGLRFKRSPQVTEESKECHPA